MAWEFRGTNGPYYTRSKKVGGRVSREYIGRGMAGELAARMDVLARQERAAKIAEFDQPLNELEEASDALDDYSCALDLLVKETLESLGFHQHNRQWRRRRNNGKRKKS